MSRSYNRFDGALKPLRLALVMAVLLFLGACSSTTFIYNRLDFILPWYLDDYVDLNRDQKASLDASLKPFLLWHRVDELPRYVQILSEIEQGLDGTVTPGMVGKLFSEVEQAWLRLEDEALDWLFELGAELSDEQIQEFLQVFIGLAVQLPRHGGNRSGAVADVHHLLYQISFTLPRQLGKAGNHAVAIGAVTGRTHHTVIFAGRRICSDTGLRPGHQQAEHYC